MSSFFDEASLVFIPSGYKTSKAYSVKPTDGTGDLTFTRSNDTATRVGPDGLIEKVRTNLATYSNDFSNAAWSKVNTTITAGQADPFGGTSAFRLLNTSAAGFVLQSGITITGSLMTASVWVKSNTASTQTMLITANSGSEQSPAISVTTSWQRVSWSFTSSGNSNILFAYNASTALDILAYGFQLEVGDVMTDYIATTTAAVSVGPVANVPRLDYLNSSCPRLLLEPQRVNLTWFSENFDNAYHTKNQASVTANTSVSPDGYTNADKLIPNTTSTDDHRLSGGTLTVTSGAAYTTSVFVKNGGYNVCSVRAANGGTVQVNLTTGAKTEYGSVTSSSVVDYGNGWYRISVTANASSTSYAPAILVQNSTASQYPLWAGNGTDGILLYGFMTEAGAYATSYIPTLGAAVTRGADDCRKGSISSILPTQTGTLYAEFDWQKTPADVQVLSIHNNSTGLAWINKSSTTSVQGTYFASGYIGTLSGAVSASAGIVKVAYAWTNGRQALYINGVQAGTDTAAITDSNDFNIFEFNGFWGIQKNGTSIASALVFPTALSNSDLAALTA